MDNIRAGWIYSQSFGCETPPPSFLSPSVFKIPLRSTSGGYKCGEWLQSDKIWSGCLWVVSCKDRCEIRLEDPNSGDLFAACFVNPGQRENVVDSVLDSSRYFVLKIEDGTGKHAFVGLGFTERNEACLSITCCVFYSRKVELETVNIAEDVTQIPARTSSAPPNLDEQKREQVVSSRQVVRTQSPKVEMIDSLFKKVSDTEDDGIMSHCGNRSVLKEKTFGRKLSSWFSLWNKEESRTWLTNFIRMNELKDQVCSSWFAPVGSASDYALLSKWVIYGELGCNDSCSGSSDGISPIYSLWATFIGLYIANYVVERSTGSFTQIYDRQNSGRPGLQQRTQGNCWLSSRICIELPSFIT